VIIAALTPALITRSAAVPACPSSPITVLAAHSDPASGPVNPSSVARLSTDLLVALAAVPDPRGPRGVRHRLVTVLAAAVCAVLAGARSYVAIAEWAHDLPVSVRVRLGIGRPGSAGGAPSESTFRRVLQTIDADELDRAVTAWLVDRARLQHAAVTAEKSAPVRAIAVDTARPPAARGGPTDGACTCLPRWTRAAGSCSGRARSRRRPTRSPGSPRCWTGSTSPAR